MINGWRERAQREIVEAMRKDFGMKVEIGKTYLTAEGRKAKVTHGNTQGILVAEVEGKSKSLGFGDDGKFLGDKMYHGNCNLVSEYKDDTQMFKVGDRVRHTETNPEEVGIIEEVKPNNRYLVNWGNESAFGFSTDSFENIVLANEQVVIKEKFVGEQPSSPVQSRKTIVEGEYGKIYVTPDEKNSVMIGMVNDFEAIHKRFNAQQLRDAIRVLGDIATFLEEGK